MLIPCLFAASKFPPVRIRMVFPRHADRRLTAAALAGPAPWTAALVAHNLSAQSGAYCGATVASPTAVITAAHCVLEGPSRNGARPAFAVTPDA